MVEQVQHLGFIKRQQALARRGPEQVAVVGHVEHSQELDTPRVLARALVHQHRDALVDFLRQFGVGAGAKNRTGLSVRVEQRQVFR